MATQHTIPCSRRTAKIHKSAHSGAQKRKHRHCREKTLYLGLDSQASLSSVGLLSVGHLWWGVTHELVPCPVALEDEVHVLACNVLGLRQENDDEHGHERGEAGEEEVHTEAHVCAREDRGNGSEEHTMQRSIRPTDAV